MTRNVSGGARIVVPANTPPQFHTHNVGDLVGASGTPDAGQSLMYGPDGWGIGSKVIPNPPSISTVTTAGYYTNPASSASAVVTANLAPPTTTTDGSAYPGTRFYEVRWCYETPANSPWTIVSSMPSQTSVTWYGVRSGASISVQARVTDVYGNVSDWSATTPQTTYIDSVAPRTPTAPTLTSRLGGINVAWDGAMVPVSITSISTTFGVSTVTTATHGLTVGDKVTITGNSNATNNATWEVSATPSSTTFTFTGGAAGTGGTLTSALPADYAYTAIHVKASSGFTPSSTDKVGEFRGAGQFIITRDPNTGAAPVSGTTYYVKLISYDVYGNFSTASTQASVVQSSLVTTDIGASSITSSLVSFTARQIGGITTSYGTTAPLSPVDGDIWMDSSRTQTASISSLAVAGATVTAVTATAHNLVVGDKVTIAGATNTNNNGTFDVTAIDSATQFKYTNPGTPATQNSAAGTAVPYGGGIQQKRYNGSTWVLQQIDRQSISANTILATQIAAGAITAGSAVIANAAIDSAKIIDLDVTKLTAGSLTANVSVTSGKIMTAASGARVEMTSGGIAGYNATGATFSLTNAGALTLNPTGATSGARLTFDSTGIKAYGASSQTVSIGVDGSMVLAGTLTGGGAIVGPAFKTASGVDGSASTAAGVLIDSSGLRAFKASTTAPTFAIASDGSAAFSGNIFGSTITTAATAGATTGARIVLDTGGSVSNTISLYPGYSSTEKAGKVTGDKNAYSSSSNSFTELIAKLQAPTLDAGGLTASITVGGHGGSTGVAFDYQQYYGPYPYIKLDYRYSNMYAGIWPRSGTNTSITLNQDFGGLMNANGYYILMQKINTTDTGAEGYGATYLSSAPSRSTFIRSNNNDATGQIVVSTGAVALTGATTVTGTLTSSQALTVTTGGLTVSAGGAGITGATTIAGALSVTSFGTTTGNIVSGAAISSTTTITAGTGLTVTTGGLTVSAGLLKCGAPTSATTGKSILTAATIHSEGNLWAEGDLKVVGGNLYMNNAGDRYLQFSSATARYNLVNAPLYATNVYSNGTLLTSDLRSKTDIQQLSGATAGLRNLNPVSYRLLVEDDTSDDVRFGLIAQELVLVYPELVREFEPGTDSPVAPRFAVDYSSLIALLIKSVQETDARLAALEGAL